MTFKITMFSIDDCEPCKDLELAVKEAISNGFDIDLEVIKDDVERAIEVFGEEPTGAPLFKIESECKSTKRLGFPTREGKSDKDVLVDMLRDVSCSTDLIKSLMEE